MTVYGGGEEREGPFTLAGTLDLDTWKLHCAKTIWRTQPVADVKPTRDTSASSSSSSSEASSDDEADATVGPQRRGGRKVNMLTPTNKAAMETKRKRRRPRNDKSASLSTSSSMSPGTLRGC